MHHIIRAIIKELTWFLEERSGPPTYLPHIAAYYAKDEVINDGRALMLFNLKQVSNNKDKKSLTELYASSDIFINKDGRPSEELLSEIKKTSPEVQKIFAELFYNKTTQEENTPDLEHTKEDTSVSVATSIMNTTDGLL